MPRPSPRQHERLIIIGSGPAGYTAAVYAARALLEPLMISGFDSGGQLMITTEVENYPGFATAIQGPWLMEQMKAQAEHVGARMVSDHVTRVELGQSPFVIHCDSGAVFTADAIIIATGAKAKWLELPSEERFKGFGVSACATCDGFFYRGKDVLVVGGGNSAVEEALYLANLARSVTLVHRRDSLRAEKILQDRLFKHPKLFFVWDTAVEEICGETDPLSVTHVKLRHLRTGEITEKAVDGVFVAIGHRPASDLFVGQLDIRPSGYLRVASNSTATNIPGVFAAGDVADDIYRQAITAAGLGCMAALEAERWLAAEESQQTPQAQAAE